jgi:hypothetical protein
MRRHLSKDKLPKGKSHMAKRGRRSRLSAVSVVDLQAELGRRQSQLRSLIGEHNALAAHLDRVRSEIEALGGTVGGRGGRRGRPPGKRGPGRPAGRGRGGRRRRPRNEANLVESLAKLLNGKTMSVTDIAEAVQKAGYKTTSSSFRTIVNQTLINSGRFKRVGRGQYTSK